MTNFNDVKVWFYFCHPLYFIDSFSLALYNFCRDVRGEGSQVIFDFSYFKNSDAIEAAIEKDAKIQDVDAMVKEEHLDNLRRFYQATTNIK